MKNAMKIVLTVFVFTVFMMNLHFSFTANEVSSEIPSAKAFKCSWKFNANCSREECLRDGDGTKCTCGDVTRLC